MWSRNELLKTKKPDIAYTGIIGRREICIKNNSAENAIVKDITIGNFTSQ